MRTTTNDDKAFIANVIPSTLLEDAIDYIKDTFCIEDVYGRDALHEWAKENGYVKED